MPKIVTKASLIRMLDEADDAKRKQIIGRACWALFQRQTEDERSTNNTRHTNMVGFSQSDARQGSITAKTWRKRGTIMDFQLEIWMTNWRGSPRIVKYHRQLNDIAESKREAA